MLLNVLQFNWEEQIPYLHSIYSLILKQYNISSLVQPKTNFDPNLNLDLYI